jgi:hypothetical protein
LETAKAHAEGLGLPDLAIVSVPDPLSGIAEDLVRLRAREVAGAVAAALTRSGREQHEPAATRR